MSSQGFRSEHWNDTDGNPAGGATFGTGFAISWQNGPLGRGDDRKALNGAFVEDIIAAARDRIEFYEQSRFSCKENRDAIHHLTVALEGLNARTASREARAVEGTHTA